MLYAGPSYRTSKASAAVLPIRRVRRVERHDNIEVRTSDQVLYSPMQTRSLFSHRLTECAVFDRFEVFSARPSSMIERRNSSTHN